MDRLFEHLYNLNIKCLVINNKGFKILEPEKISQEKLKELFK